MKENATRTGKKITMISIPLVLALALLLGLGQPAGAATTAAVTQSVSTAQTHEWEYDGPFPDPWSCKWWGNFGLDQGWWSGWMCVKSGLTGPWILWVKPYH
ncbi:hypothetical protein P3102_07730 [Amycolatopsis sp. QT-25]|uniref:hypothetical protein n=1 Tax=Amycolatopsis sp. QT-25 TaxID=3034022 RepID=UPI0023ED2735|nr:hypothetical protein [Amycolatopsis sp. QT-25]WET81104.1 hypothetical protein P3102_07730 [Amycolatopsis sp. QT-25]